MTYITTNHRFIIDDKHPSDVFDEMENFFSLYTTAIDQLQQVSVQLSVPPSFDITGNKKMAESYRQFTQSLKYTLPDMHILPIKTHNADGQDDATADDAENSVILLIQRLDGEGIDADEAPNFYQSVLGKLIPRFAGEKSDTGLYPVQAPITLPEPIRPQPVSQPVQPIVTQPNAQPPYQPLPQPLPQNQPPQPAPQYQHQPLVQPPVQKATPLQPQPQPSVPQPMAVPSPQPVVQSQPILQTSTQVPSQISSHVAAPPKPAFSVLPNIQKSTKPYQDLLTQAVVNEAKKMVDKTQVIRQITLKSNDGLTTAMIEQLFNSFNHAHEPVDQSQSAHDAIDLVSYGYEVLKPQLAAIGVSLSDEAQFALKTKAQATPADFARLARGEVVSNEIKLGVKLVFQSAIATTNPTHTTASQPTATQSSVQAPVHAKATPPHLNQNLQQIVLIIKCIDGLGERQQKMREFPIVFASRDAQIAHALRLFAPNDIRLASGVYFSIVESQGQLFIDDIDPQVTISRNGQPIKPYNVLMPNDELMINHTMRVQLLLAN